MRSGSTALNLSHIVAGRLDCYWSRNTNPWDIAAGILLVREAGGGRTGWKWASFQFGYMLALAYGAALLVYQGGRLLGLG